MRLTKRTLTILIILAVLVVAGAIAAASWLSSRNRSYTLSGTIEAVEVHVATTYGGEVKDVYVEEGDMVGLGTPLALLYSHTDNMSERLKSPLEGVVLEKLFEPGELAMPGEVVIVVADLSRLQLKIYAPEDRYGQFALGQIYPVSVDSYPGQTFDGKVSHIAGQAEFTPRNVQTVAGRKSTVFAITLDIVAPNNQLIPGMPADVLIQGR